MVSDEVYNLVISGAKWYVHKTRDSHYEIAKTANSKELEEGWSKQIKLHRFILGMKKDNKKLVDHKNGWLDNTFESLRITTKTNNNRYTKARKRTKNFDLPKGVRKTNSKLSPYKAYIGYNGKQIYLGVFKTPEEAHKAYCEAALKYFGEYAKFE